MKLVPIALVALTASLSLLVGCSAVRQDAKPLSKEAKALIEKAEKGDAKAEDQFQR